MVPGFTKNSLVVLLIEMTLHAVTLDGCFFVSGYTCHHTVFLRVDEYFSSVQQTVGR